MIGGAAGALPPIDRLGGGDRRPRRRAAFLFLIIFFWTPPHFWALSLYRMDETMPAPACRCCRSSPAKPKRAGRSCSTP